MAKKKAGQAPKATPRARQIWEDSSGLTAGRVEVVAAQQDGTGQDGWECIRVTPGPDGDSRVTCHLYLADFAEATMQLLSDPDAVAASPVSTADALSPPVEPEIMVVPTKKGYDFVCPSPSCGDKHPMEMAMPWEEVCAARQRFYERHRDHLLDGTLFGGQKQ